MKINKTIISFFGLASVFLVIALVLISGGYKSQISKAGVKSLASIAPGVTQIELEENYKIYAANIFSVFYGKAAKYSSPEIATEAKEGLLALKVPVNLRQTHLDLIISLGLVEQGLKNNGDQLVLGEQKIEELAETESWLLGNK